MTGRPRLLDVCSGAGGCAMGYHRAGFDVVCVDHLPHPDNPFELIVADALEVLRDRAFLDTFDVVHASFPCPRWSISGNATGRADVPLDDARRLMGVEWMTDREDVADAIPPVYTEYVGAQLLDALVTA